MKRPTISLALIRLIVLVGLLTAAAAGIAILGTEGVADLMESAADSQWRIAALSGLIVLGVVLMVPGTLGTITAGALLGFAVGFPVAYLSALVGSVLAFFISRAVGKEGMNQLLGDRVTSIDEWLMKNDFLSILVLRLMPVVPFNALNYAAGLTGVRASRYIAASAIGIAPGSALSAFAASRADDMASTAFLGAAGAVLFVTLLSIWFARRYSSRVAPSDTEVSGS